MIQTKGIDTRVTKIFNLRIFRQPLEHTTLRCNKNFLGPRILASAGFLIPCTQYRYCAKVVVGMEMADPDDLQVSENLGQLFAKNPFQLTQSILTTVKQVVSNPRNT